MTNRFWKTIENGLATRIPPHVKIILEQQSLNNHITMKLLEEKDIEKLEMFVKSEKYDKYVRNLIIQKKIFCGRVKMERLPIKNAYGIYFDDPENFQFSVGEKNLILSMAKFVKDNEIMFS